ncbi:MAG: hypothetical protein IPJ41_17970 [Phycisphaerales bacterium]|nr:hypothetical protein [Phycisphaerales bacterium]
MPRGFDPIEHGILAAQARDRTLERSVADLLDCWIGWLRAILRARLRPMGTFGGSSI